MSIYLKAKAEDNFEKKFFTLMNSSTFGKTMENVRKHLDIKFVTINKKRSHLESKLIYDAIKWILENLLGIEMNKINVKINKPVYLGLLIQTYI